MKKLKKYLIVLIFMLMLAISKDVNAESDLQSNSLKFEAQINQDSNWQYHVTKNHYYGIANKEGNFEIGWGVGMDSDYGTKQYKIQYTVVDAITKANDYAELYWQFIGKEFEVPANKVTGTVKLPMKKE